MNSCAATCLFIWAFLLLDPHERRVTLNVQFKNLVKRNFRKYLFVLLFIGSCSDSCS